MKNRIGLIFASFAFLLSACSAGEPERISLTGVVYNYSNETIAFVKTNSKQVGSGLNEVANGNVAGGSGICCFYLNDGDKTTEVEVTLWDESKYKTTATIEKWWPDLAHYGVVHILPGRKVVMQVTPSAPRPRKDLLEARQKELGLEQKTLFDYWSAGPIERIDGKK